MCSGVRVVEETWLCCKIVVDGAMSVSHIVIRLEFISVFLLAFTDA
jgi:hypothetical protein